MFWLSIIAIKSVTRRDGKFVYMHCLSPKEVKEEITFRKGLLITYQPPPPPPPPPQAINNEHSLKQSLRRTFKPNDVRKRNKLCNCLALSNNLVKSHTKVLF